MWIISEIWKNSWSMFTILDVQCLNPHALFLSDARLCTLSPSVVVYIKCTSPFRGGIWMHNRSVGVSKFWRARGIHLCQIFNPFPLSLPCNKPTRGPDKGLTDEVFASAGSHVDAHMAREAKDHQDTTLWQPESGIISSMLDVKHVRAGHTTMNKLFET